MKVVHALGEALFGSVAILSMYSSSLDLFPSFLNTLMLGGGAGLLAVTLVLSRGKDAKPMGEVGALPGLPEEAQRAPTAGPRSAGREHLLRKYDRAFQEMLSRQGADPKSQSLSKLTTILYDLSPEIKVWSGDVRLRVYLLMQELAKDLEDPQYTKASLGLLVLLLSRGGSPAVEMARPIFRERIANMYQRPEFETERFIPRLLLMLDDYDRGRVESLTKDAIHVWGDERFKAAGGFLGFEELKDRGLRAPIKGLLGEEIARAGSEFDRTALNRAVELYHQVS